MREATLAQRYDVCTATVNNIRKRHNLPPRVCRVSKEDRELIVRLYGSGMAGEKIAEELRIQKTTVYNVLRHSHIRVRGVRKWAFDDGFFRARNETTAYWMGLLDGGWLSTHKYGSFPETHPQHPSAPTLLILSPFVRQPAFLLARLRRCRQRHKPKERMPVCHPDGYGRAEPHFVCRVPAAMGHHSAQNI